MSLKEWKNNELNGLLLKKWGLLKEGKQASGNQTIGEEWAKGQPAGGPLGDSSAYDRQNVPCDGAGNKRPDWVGKKAKPVAPCPERDSEGNRIEEDSEGEETYHYGEDEGRDDHELHDLIKRHATKAHIDALKRDMDYDEDHEDRHERGTDFREGMFSPNHYCVHHGGVQHEGQIKMAEAISHNFDKKLNKVTWYDMKLQDGTILEQVATEDIMVTNASLAEMHRHRVEDEDDYEGIGSKEHDDEEGNRPSMAKRMDLTERTRSGKISVREAKEITRRIIARVKQENK